MQIAEALRAGVAQLNGASVPDAPREARLLMAHALQVKPDRITLLAHDPLPEAAAQCFTDGVARRCQRQPISHIIARRQFWGRDFIVTPEVLDPRPETEILIAEALKHPFERILDLGTGSGAILLTLLAERANATGLGGDLSADALAVARRNAAQLGVADRAEFAQGSWFDALDGRACEFDLIVSNPPYLALSEMSDLAPELAFEPDMALTDFSDGLSVYRILTATAQRFLRPKGWLMVEIGWQQGAAVQDLFVAAGWTEIACITDFDGRDRVVIGQKSAE